MTLTFFQVFSSVRSLAEAMSKELRNLTASVLAELSSHSQRFVVIARSVKTSRRCNISKHEAFPQRA